MPLFYKQAVSTNMKSLKDYKQVNLTKNQLLEKLVDILSKANVDFVYKLDVHNLPQSEQVIMSNFEYIPDFKSLPFRFIDSDNDGDGNDLVVVYALLDETNKTYTLFGFFGTYSSWSGSEWDSIELIELEPVEMYQPKIIK